MRGWSVFTRPSSISGKPVTAATSVTGRPAVAQRRGRAAGRDELEPEPDEARSERGQARLVADREQRATRHRIAARRVRRSPACRPVAARRRRHGPPPGQEPVLDRLDPLVERRLVVAGQDRDRLLGDDRAAVERLVDEVDRAAGHPDAVGERVADGVRAREGRQQRGMRVQDPARRTPRAPRPDDPHVAGEDDDVDRRGRGSRRARDVVGPHGISAVSIPCSAAQTSAGQSRSAKTSRISPPSSPRAAAAARARRLLPAPDTPTASRRARPPAPSRPEPTATSSGLFGIGRRATLAATTSPTRTASGAARRTVATAPGGNDQRSSRCRR